MLGRRAIAVSLVFAALFAGAALWWRRQPPRAGPGPVPVVPEIARAARRGRPVIFLGLDGADWQLLDRYMLAGSMPQLAALVKEGAGGVLESIHPPLSPLVWTTMMTGLSPLDHGILDFTRFDPATGQKEPITSDERLEPAIWNMASDAGRSVASVGLWATYPAERVNGLMVSDRLFSFLFNEAAPEAGVVFPKEREAWARDALRRAESGVGLAQLREYMPWLDAAEYDAHAHTQDPYGHPISALRRILVETRVFDELGSEYARSEKPDLTIVYLEGTDSIGHVFAPFAPPRQPEVSEEDYARYHEVPERYFRYVDSLIGKYRALAEERGAVLMIASDHGFKWGEGRPTRLSSFAHTTAAKWHRQEGVFLLWGPGITPAPDHPLRGKVAQVCGTLLALLGLPSGSRLAAPPLGGVAATPGDRVDYRAYYTRAAPVTTASGAGDAEALEKLKALGYIGAGETAKAPDASRRAGSTRTAGSYNNEGLLLMNAGKTDRAIAAYEKALEIEPKLASALWNLSDLLFAKDRDLDRSDRLLIEAFADGLPEGTRFLIGRAIGYQRKGQLERAERLMAGGKQARPDEPEVWLFAGRYQVEAGRCREAVTDFERATRLAPENPGAFASLGVAQLCLGARAAASQAFRRSLALDPNQPRIRQYLEGL
jgi:Flp pilus assembly protein TadD/predicted AlkP superfamily pyrophosphatase or phosphodiesterase